MKTTPTYNVRLAERVVALLAALADAESPQTLTAVAERAGMAIPTAFRVLRTLEEFGLVMSHPPDKRYTLGFRILQLSQALLRQLDIVEIARPILISVRNEVNETVTLAVRQGDFSVHVVAAEAAHEVHREIAL